jgi:hypothetical protein
MSASCFSWMSRILGDGDLELFCDGVRSCSAFRAGEPLGERLGEDMAKSDIHDIDGAVSDI